MDVNWANGFYFGSVKWDEAKGASGGEQPAFKNLAFYCGTGWTRGGVWNDAGNDNLYASMAVVAAFDDANYLFDGNWHHIVGTYSNRVMRIFVDGRKMGEKVRSADLNVTANPYIQIGNYAPGDPVHAYQGDLDEIQWLVGAWSEEEVAAEYAARDPRARRAPLLPAPVAHWTFDEQKADRGYVDVTGNGFDLENVASNGTAYVEQEAVAYADDPSFTGGAAVVKAKTSYLRLKEGVDLGTRLTGSFTISLRTTYPANGTFFMLGNGAVANSVQLGDSGCPRMQYWMVGGTGDGNTCKYADSGTYFGSNGSTLPSAYGVNTLVYDAQKKVLLVYRDAVLQMRRDGFSFTLKPTQLQWGCVGEKSFTDLRLDDLRLYNTALTGAQVAELARAVRQGAAPIETTVLPPEARVEVAAGATFSARGVVDCVLGTLSGAGRVDIGGGSTLRAADYAAFAGTVSGAGCLDFDGAARMPSAATVEADVRMEALRLAVADAGRADPFVTTAGRVLVPATGRVTFPDAAGPGALAGKRWTLAKGASVTLPDDLSGWTVSPEPSVGWTFKASEDGTLTLSIGGGGTHIFLR